MSDVGLAGEPLVVRLVRDGGGSPQEQGHRFERLMRAAFEANPQYDFERVWLWGDWPGRDGPDSGVDLVAERADGRLCAIQCKLYDSQSKVPSGDIDSFLAKAGQHQFGDSLLVATGDLTGPSWQKIVGASKPCQVLLGHDLNEWPVRWADFVDSPSGLRFEPPKTPRDDQAAAVERILKGFEEHSRGCLLMPCGTGKSLVSLWAAEQQAGVGGRVLYLVPSIALIAQTMKQWAAQKSVPHRYGAICSDVTTGRGTVVGSSKADLAELLAPASTDRAQIADLLNAPVDRDTMTVYFCTYQSLPVLAEVLADRAAGVVFDLMVCDEAHRTTGIASGRGQKAKQAASAFTLCHDDDRVPAVRRLYQTATPKVFTERQRRRVSEQSADGTFADIDAYSMDDVSVYGPVFSEMSFNEAIDMGLICDYKVLVIGVNERTADELGAGDRVVEIAASDEARKAKLNAHYAAKLIGCWDALATPQRDSRWVNFKSGQIPDNPAHRHLRAAIAFTNTVKQSRAASESGFFAGLGLEGNLWEAVTNDISAKFPGLDFLRLKVDHADGTTPASDRSRLLTRLAAASEPADSDQVRRECVVLSNAQLFTEGVDVPSLDAVIFLEPRRSPVQVTQAVGRAMRKAPGKDFGWIVIPVVVPDGARMSDEAVLASSDFDTVWEVVRALRSHDERVDYWVNNPRAKSPLVVQPPRPDSDDDEAAVPDTEQLALFASEIESAVRSKLVETNGDRHMWAHWGKNAATVCENVRRRLDAELGQPDIQAAFSRFVAAMSEAVGSTVTEPQAAEMVAQHVVTIPVFDHLFEDSGFAATNPVSVALTGFLDELAVAHSARHKYPDRSSADLVFGDLTQPLNRAYRTMQAQLESALTASEKVDVLREIYESFFAEAMPDTVQRLGIVYTPVEIVDFMLRAADAICQRHFGQRLTDEDVHILDPFAGTGTFLYRLLTHSRFDGSPLIDDTDIVRKLTGNNVSEPELHANEIVLLAYYIAALKIEAGAVERGLSAVQRRPQGIVYGDTFAESRQPTVFPGFADNSERAAAQNRLPIRVIIGNPPWSAGQKSAGDNNPRPEYAHIGQRIRDTYGEQNRQLGQTSAKALGNSYVEAIRWASDRVSDGGVVAFVHPNSLATGPSLAGMRAALRHEFTDIYVVNLRGDAYKSGAESKLDGQSVFGIEIRENGAEVRKGTGSRNGVQITFLVNDPERAGQAGGRVYYAEVPDGQTLAEKFAWLSYLAPGTGAFWGKFHEIRVTEQHDWVNLTDGTFGDMIPVCAKASDSDGSEAVHESALGLATNCDGWVYAWNRSELERKVRRLIDGYNAAVDAVADGRFVDDAVRKFGLPDVKWHSVLKRTLRRGERIEFDAALVREVLYRPFVRKWLYVDDRILASVRRVSALFPDIDGTNVSTHTHTHTHTHISFASPSNRTRFGTLAGRGLTDLNCLDGGGRIVPRKRSS